MKKMRRRDLRSLHEMMVGSHCVYSLSAQLGESPSTISRSIERLQNFGLVENKVDIQARGKNILHPTSMGKHIARISIPTKIDIDPEKNLYFRLDKKDGTPYLVGVLHGTHSVWPLPIGSLPPNFKLE